MAGLVDLGVRASRGIVADVGWRELLSSLMSESNWHLPGGLAEGSRPSSAGDLHRYSAAPLTTGNMWQQGQRQVGEVT